MRIMKINNIKNFSCEPGLISKNNIDTKTAIRGFKASLLVLDANKVDKCE